MKHLPIATFSLLASISFDGKSQLLSENFNSGQAAGWSQSPAASWSISTSLGANGSLCIVSDGIGFATDTVSLHTPTLNLTSVTNLTVSFKAAVTRNNFVAPEIALFCDTGSGKQLLATWSSGLNPSATYTLSQGFDWQIPPSAQSIQWQTCTHVLSAISSTMAGLRLKHLLPMAAMPS